MSHCLKGENMDTNNTAEKYCIALHPHHNGELILTETSTGGVLKTGTRDEMIAFCKEKLAASVSIPELEEIIDNAACYINNETSCPIVEENSKQTYSISRSYEGVSLSIQLTAGELESAYRVQEMNYLTEDVENFLESEDCGFSIFDFGKNGLQDIALLFRDKYNDCNIPYWTGIRHAVERYAKENNIEPHFDDEEFNGPDNDP